jgi:hypothetical protein
MSVSAMTTGRETTVQTPWLRSRRWDLFFISLSVILVAMPYTAYLILINLGHSIKPIADLMGADVDGFSRNLVNFTVAFLVGGPHMYVTWTRTYFNHDFSAKHRRYAMLSLIVPVVVITLAFLNLTLLLTIFFFWASIHVLHQIVYVTEMYNKKQTANLLLSSRLADYAVILTALYPLAAWKIATGRFMIGTNNLGEVVGQFVPIGPWMVWLTGAAFGLSLVWWIAKSVKEWREGELHVPKTLFIALTVSVSFIVPALGNLDTAFQGMNVWHSFQYLALTWLLINLANRRGQLKNSPFVERLSETGSSRKYYGWAVLMTVGTVVFAAILFSVFRFGLGHSFDLSFDRAYYISVLSVLWIHYYFDHFLFTQPQAIIR